MTKGTFISSLPVRTITVSGLPTRYADFGTGMPVLSLHGAMGAHDQGAILARLALSQTHRIIAPSRPGYPGSKALALPGPEAEARHLLALMTALGIERFAVLAISGGGPAAIQLAVDFPDRCTGLILVSTVTQPNPVHIPKGFGILKAMARIPGLPALLRARSSRRLEKRAARSFPDTNQRQAVLSDGETRSMFKAFSEGIFDGMAERLSGSLSDMRVASTAAPELDRVKVPTLILHGSADPVANYDCNAKEAARLIPNAELLTLDAAGHGAIFSHAKIIRDATARFLDRRRPEAVTTA